MRYSTCWLGLLVFLSASNLAVAQFEPEVSTSFANLDAGAESDLAQQLTLLDGDENFSSLLMSFDVGSFELDAIEIDDSIGFAEIILEFAPGSPNNTGTVAGDGEITCDIIVTYVDDSLLEADVIATEVNDDAADAIEDAGGEDPTDEVVFTVVVNADDLTIELVDTGAIPSATDLDSDIEMSWELAAGYAHAAAGGTLTITDLVTSTDGDEWELEETFDLIGSASTFMRGDVDGNGSVSALLDSLELLEWAFAGGDEPICHDAADADDSGSVSALIDALRLLNWAFAGGDAPPEPGPDECGTDPADPNDDIGCEDSTC